MMRVDHRKLRIHIGLNYNFGISPNTNIDSARVGNETRYINHGRDAVANARAESASMWSMLSVYRYS